LGWIATPGMLIYGTGGLALTEIKVANAFSDSNAPNPGSGAGSNSVTKVGWTVGGGVEWMLVSNWRVKAEYLYVDFGNVSSSLAVTCGACGSASSQLTTSSDLTAHIVRLGLNYEFGG
jgi:outer membrane immunogenic protein